MTAPVPAAPGTPAAWHNPDLAWTVTVVTGAGRGLSRILAQALAGAGAAAGLVARSGRELAGTARLITTAGGTAAIASADVSDPDLAAETGRNGVRVFSVHPGITRSGRPDPWR